MRQSANSPTQTIAIRRTKSATSSAKSLANTENINFLLRFYCLYSKYRTHFTYRLPFIKWVPALLHKHTTFSISITQIVIHNHFFSLNVYISRFMRSFPSWRIRFCMHVAESMAQFSENKKGFTSLYVQLNGSSASTWITLVRVTTLFETVYSIERERILWSADLNFDMFMELLWKWREREGIKLYRL